MSLYTYSEIENLAIILTTRINKIRKQPDHIGISTLTPIKLVVHTWNNIKCLRLTRPESDTPTSESEFTRYFNTFEQLADCIHAIHATLDLTD